MSPQTLLEHVSFMRKVFVRSLEDALKDQDTTNTCAFACALLYVSLSKFLNVEVAFQGGGGSGTGYLDSSDVTHGHYWLKAICRNTQEAWVIDITADQFGGPPVVVQRVADSLSNYIPGDQRTVDENMSQVLSQLGA